MKLFLRNTGQIIVGMFCRTYKHKDVLFSSVGPTSIKMIFMNSPGIVEDLDRVRGALQGGDGGADGAHVAPGAAGAADSLQLTTWRRFAST